MQVLQCKIETSKNPIGYNDIKSHSTGHKMTVTCVNWNCIYFCVHNCVFPIKVSNVNLVLISNFHCECFGKGWNCSDQQTEIFNSISWIMKSWGFQTKTAMMKGFRVYWLLKRKFQSKFHDTWKRCTVNENCYILYFE